MNDADASAVASLSAAYRAGADPHRLLQRRPGGAVGGRQRRGRHHQRHQPAGPGQPAGGRQPAAGADRVSRRTSTRCTSTATSPRSARCSRPTMPRAFSIAADGSLTRQHRLLHQRRTDQHQPPGGHVHDQPQGGVERRHPDHVGGHRVPDQRHQRQGQGLRDRQSPTAASGSPRSPAASTTARRHDLRQAVRRVAGHVRRQHHAVAEEHDRHPGGVQQGPAQRPRAVGRTVHRLQPSTAPRSESR